MYGRVSNLGCTGTFATKMPIEQAGRIAIIDAVNPSIRYATRKPTDPPNDLAQGEALLIQGAGHQTSTSGRWGDYSAIGVDISDGCTFWMTNEYYSATSSVTWNTRIGAFGFPDCSRIFADGFEPLVL